MLRYLRRWFKSFFNIGRVRILVPSEIRRGKLSSRDRHRYYRKYGKDQLTPYLHGKKVRFWKQIYLSDSGFSDEFVPVFYPRKKSSNTIYLKGNALQLSEGSYYSEQSATGDYTRFCKVRRGKIKTVILEKPSKSSNGGFTKKEITPLTNQVNLVVKEVYGYDKDKRVKTWKVVLYKPTSNHSQKSIRL